MRSSSPPSSHGVGSASSETWSQRTSLAEPVRAGGDGEPRPRARRCRGRSASRRSSSTSRPTVVGPTRSQGRSATRRGRVRRRGQNRRALRQFVRCRAASSWDGIAVDVPAGADGPRRPRRRRRAALRRARRLDAPLVVERADGARGRGRRRPRVRRLRRRHRLPEHGPRLRPGRGRDPRAGRPLPAPVLHGRDVRAVRRRLPAARRALAVRRRGQRSRCSSTPAPRRSRTRSRSRAPRPDGRRSSSSTTRSTAGRS